MSRRQIPKAHYRKTEVKDSFRANAVPHMKRPITKEDLTDAWNVFIQELNLSGEIDYKTYRLWLHKPGMDYTRL